MHLVRLALRQLYELADSALSPKNSSDGCGEGPEDNTEEDEGKEPGCTGAPSSELDRLRLRLERLQRLTDRLKRCREEQAMLLRQKETQVRSKYESRLSTVFSLLKINSLP